MEEQSKEVIKELLFSSDEGSIANDEKKTERDCAKRSYDAEIRSLLSSDYSKVKKEIKQKASKQQELVEGAAP